jgi:hypothetical protein
MKRYAISLKQFTGWHFLLTEKMQPVRWVQKTQKRLQFKVVPILLAAFFLSTESANL